MKNINEQIERIKQLFTEERLHGNLVDDENTIEEQDMWKRGRKASEMTKDAERKRDSFRSDEEEEEFKKEFKKEAERIERFYKKDRKAFKRKYTYIEPNEYGDYKLFSHKDGIGDGKTIKLVKFPKGEKSTDFNIKQAKGLLVKYLNKKLNLKEGSYEIKQLHPKKDVDNSSYVVFSYIPNAIPSKGKSKTSAAKKSTPKSSDSKSDDKSNDKVPVKTNDITVDDTDARNIQVKSEKNDSLTNIDMNDDDIEMMKDRFNIKKIVGVVYDLDQGIMTITDGKGKEHNLSMNERKFTKKSLLEMTNTFDINTMLLEQFKDNDGNAINFSFADQLKKPSEEKVEKEKEEEPKEKEEEPKEKEEKVSVKPNEDDITKKWKSNSEIGCVMNLKAPKKFNKDESVTIAGLKFMLDGTYKNIGQPDVSSYGEKNTIGKFSCSIYGEVEFEPYKDNWDDFPCVKTNRKAKKKAIKGSGDISYDIDGKIFYNNGRVVYGKERSDYKCVDGKIVISAVEEKNKLKKAKEEKEKKKNAEDVLMKDVETVYDKIGVTLSHVWESDMKVVLDMLKKYEDMSKLCDFVKKYNLMDDDGMLDSLEDVGTWFGAQGDMNYLRNQAVELIKKCGDN